MPSSVEHTRRLILAALLSTAGICLNLAEAQFPLPIPLPGAKLGLANIVTLICLYTLPLRFTTAVLFLRIFLVAVMTGTLASPSFLIALAGACASMLSMLAARKFLSLTPLGVSLVGAATHNLGQIVMAAFIIGSTALFYYLPLLLLLAVPAGCVTGFAAKAALKTLTRKI